MRPLSASECITPAIERTKSLLFRPFQWRPFLKLTAVAFFAEIGATSFSFNSPGHHGSGLPGISPAAQAILFALLFGLIIVAFVVGLIMLYIGSRLQLVLLEVVATHQTTIAPIWRRYSRLTWRWIGLKLLFFLIFGLAFLAALAPAIISMIKSMPPGTQIPSAALFSHLLSFIGVLVLGVLVIAAVYFLLRDFALPFLEIEDLSITETLKRLRSLVAAEPGEIALYILFRFLLSLVAGVAAEILIVLVLLVSLIPLGVIGGLLWWPLHHAGAVGTAALVSAAIVGGVILLVWMACVIIGCAGTLLVFTQAYALYFLGGRYTLLGNVLEPPQPLYSTPPPQLAPDGSGPATPAPL